MNHLKTSLFYATLFLWIWPAGLHAQEVYLTDSTYISFFSEAPVEDIYADNNRGVSALNTVTDSIFFTVPIKGFQFEKALMQEHFNENFMESDQYPNAKFSGAIVGKVDYNKNGRYEVRADGQLTVHGVTQPRRISARITVKDQRLIGATKFMVPVADHDIEIPKMLTRNIAEEVEVKVKAYYSPYEE